MIMTIPEIIIASIIAILGYFLKIIHTDVRTNTKEIGENKGSIHECKKDVEHERELRDQSLKNIFGILNEIKESLKNIKRWKSLE